MVRKLGDNNSERKRSIRSEEVELWSEMMGDVKPIDQSNKRVAPKVDTVGDQNRGGFHPHGENNSGVAAGYPASYDPNQGFDFGVEDFSNSSNSSPKILRPSESEQLPLDRKNLRRIGKGHISIDDRIDLHGMRQSQAQQVLLQFLRRAQLQQFKTVLVITGKGRLKTERSENWMDDRDVGVLRREVPNWLKSDDLSDVVLGFSDALPQHGGSGALYVRLRRPR